VAIQHGIGDEIFQAFICRDAPLGHHTTDGSGRIGMANRFHINVATADKSYYE
jgi:hypothetical protein